VTPFYMKQVGVELDNFHFSDVAMFEIVYSFMIHREKSKLYNTLNAFIADYESSGSLQRIINNYIH